MSDIKGGTAAGGTLHPRWDASRKLDGLEKILLVLMFPIAVALYPAAWVWARIKRWRML